MDLAKTNKKNIPYKIFQTWETLDLPPNMKLNVQKLKESQPDFEHYLFDDNMCQNYINKNATQIDNDVYQAYMDLIPGAFRADLWRLCVLYLEGGVYMDIKMSFVDGFVDGFDLKTLCDKNHFVRDIKKSGSGIYNAFMISEPKNPQILMAIKQIILNVKKRFYGTGVLTITGPTFLKNIITDDVDMDHIPSHIKYGDKIVIKNEYSEYRSEQKKSRLPRYQKLYKLHRVYQNNLIPKTVYYTFKDDNFTDDIKHIIKINKELNPNYEFKFYNDTMCEEFIKSNFDTKTHNAYMLLNPKLGAARADFWRYCILYINGGVYIDIKIQFTKSLDLILDTNDEYILDVPKYRDINRSLLPYSTHEQWLLISRPRHPYLREIISYIVENINKRYNPQISNYLFFAKGPTPKKEQILKLTGPDAYSYAINKAIIQNGNIKQHRCVNYNYFTTGLSNNNIKAKLELYKSQNLIHYSESTESLYIDTPTPYIYLKNSYIYLIYELIWYIVLQIIYWIRELFNMVLDKIFYNI